MLPNTIRGNGTDQLSTLTEAWAQWQTDGGDSWEQMYSLVETLDTLRK